MVSSLRERMDVFDASIAQIKALLLPAPHPPYYWHVFFMLGQIFGGSAGHVNRWDPDISGLLARLQFHPILQTWVSAIGLVEIIRLAKEFLQKRMYTEKPKDYIIPFGR